MGVVQVAETERLVPVLLLSFSRDPFVRWLFPDPGDFVTYFRRLSRLHGARVAPHGGAFARTDLRAAALWYPPGLGVDGDAFAALLGEAGAADRAAGVFDAAADHEPHEPHWYLRQIGVDPASQGRGLGGELLDAALELTDEAGTPAYLEATSRPGRDFYRRHGFTELGEVSVDGSPPLWPMRRDPR